MNAHSAAPGRLRRRARPYRQPIWLPLLLAALFAPLGLLAFASLDRPARQPKAPVRTGSLASGTAALLPVPSGGLAGLAGQAVSGQGLSVQAVNGNEGFWVWRGSGERVYVEFGGDVGRDEASRFQPRVGDRVNLAGPLERAPADPRAKLKLNAQDAALVRSQGAFVNADRVGRVR
jgi:hypothetical protein